MFNKLVFKPCQTERMAKLISNDNIELIVVENIKKLYIVSDHANLTRKF